MTEREITEPGVYFGLPAETYHRIEALSNSGTKWLLVSPLDFWARCPWLNPDYEENDTDAQATGRAYHDRIVEGREAFYARNAAALDPADYPGALRTVEDLKGALAEMGQKVGGTKPALIERLLEADPAAQVWDELVADHRGDHAGKALLPAELIRKIEISAAMIERHPELSKAFSGGMPEVTVVWRDEEYDVPMKARLDYLKPRAVVDLKTFGNPHGRPIDKAIATAVANYRYHQQVYVYLEAANQAAEHIRAGRVFGEAEPGFLQAVAGANERTFLFVFQQTGIAPVARGKVFPRGLVYDCGKIVVREAMHRYRENMDRFGKDPWVDVTAIGSFDDSEFPAYMTE